jgi:hypothetical protein
MSNPKDADDETLLVHQELPELDERLARRVLELRSGVEARGKAIPRHPEKDAGPAFAFRVPVSLPL